METDTGGVRCEPATGYKYVSDYTATAEVTVTINDEICYTANSVSGDALEWTFYLPNGEVAAMATVGTDQELGRCPSLEPPGSEPVYYPHDRSDPRCAAMRCSAGTCD